jgi:hypothetical protein
MRHPLFYHLQIVRPGQIGRDWLDGDLSFTLDLLRQRFEAVTSPGYQNEIVPLAPQAPRERGANPRRRAGDERTAVRNSIAHGILLFSAACSSSEARAAATDVIIVPGTEGRDSEENTGIFIS